MTAGRPSKYKPQMCDEVLPFMAQGYSTTALAGHLKVSRQTLYDWMDAHPEFLDAVKEGQAASAIWWEDCLRDNAQKGEGNATAAIFGLKNRASDDWRDKREHDHTTNGKDMPAPSITMGMTPQEAAEAYAAMLDQNKT